MKSTEKAANCHGTEILWTSSFMLYDSCLKNTIRIKPVNFIYIYIRIFFDDIIYWWCEIKFQVARYW